MFVVIDNTVEGEIIFNYLLNNKIVQARFAGKDAESGIIFCLNGLLKTVKKKIKELEAVAVFVGSGRYTASRLSATVANTLAFALEIPVVAVERGSDMKKIFEKIKKKKAGKYIIPKYSGEANIGKKNLSK
ncbi:MAG: hypothetical protein AAB348_02270 [Patescibacteria group bacterium]